MNDEALKSKFQLILDRAVEEYYKMDETSVVLSSASGRSKGATENAQALVDEMLNSMVDSKRIPEGIFPKGMRLSSREIIATKIFPRFFTHCLRQYPGHFEDIFGYLHMASAELLEQLVNLGEPVSLILHEDVKMPGGKGNVGFDWPACHYPVFNLTRHASEISHGANYSGKIEEIINNCDECLRLLIGAGANINQRGSEGQTIFDCILTEDVFPSVMQRIIPVIYKFGGIPDMSNSRYGETMLHKAMEQFGRELRIDLKTLEAILLFPHPMDMAGRNHRGITPLDACWINPALSPKALEAFLARAMKEYGGRGANPLFPVSDSKPPLLYLLARRGHPHFEEICDLLLLNGASLGVKLKPSRADSYFENLFLGPYQYGSKLCDVVLENKEEMFEPRVVDYFRTKMRSLK